MAKREERGARAPSPENEGEQRPRHVFDLTNVLVMLLVLAILLFLTFDLWPSHPGNIHR